jgi:hypothetical protein
MNGNMKSLRMLVLLLAVGAFPAFLSAQASPNSFNVGVAQVNGKIHLVASDPAASLADFTVASADTGTIQAKIAFKSKRTAVQNDEVNVIGDLTLTLLERDANYSPGEDYAGPVYGERVERHVTRQVVFVIPMEDFAKPNAKTGISATALIGRESFAALLPAIYAVNWPPVVEDEHCQLPASAGEDYAGPHCTGTVVETHNAASVPANVGEDYRGSESAVPAGDQVKIVLNLHFAGKGSGATASFFIG